MKINHFSHHQHPLAFISAAQSSADTIQCSGCDQTILEEEDGGWTYYGCKECKYYLHKECGELELAPEINHHPFHPNHLLSLFPKSPYDGSRFICDFCGGASSGFVYHCDVCGFDLHVNCALLRSSIAPNFPNSLHPHPLFFLPNHNQQLQGDCYVCTKPLSGPIYHCSDCSFNLHKGCGELELSPQINHPFHPQHLLYLLPESPYNLEGINLLRNGLSAFCNFCDRALSGFVYHCDVCNFDLHVNCAFLESSIAPNFPISLHPHPLFFLPNHNQLVRGDCCGCKKPLSGPIYYCSVCCHPKSFNLHKECAELALEMNHPYDRDHPLTLLPKMPTHPRECSCYMCKIQWEGFVYSCSLCNVDLTTEDAFAQRTITNIATHQHPWTLISRQMSFICDFCGTAGDRTPYLCATCGLLVHKNCIPLPRKIMITRHRHVISHSYFLREDQLEERICRICYEEVNTRYGCYHCRRSDCSYVAHALCATDKDIWDGTTISEDLDESSMDADSSNLITNIFEEMIIEDQMVAVEIKHAFHDHNLRLTFSDEIKHDEDSQCDGCMRTISTPFYSCETCDECDFFLHKDCAELPRENRHPFHKHLLTLTNSHGESGFSACSACNRSYNGFIYKCKNEGCNIGFECDIRCILLSDTLKHPSHEHLLFLVHNVLGTCSGCRNPIATDVAYRCVKRCGFTLHIICATKPLTARFKYDKHPLTLTYSDDSDPLQHFCDLCEEERDPNEWFYHCYDCDNALHSRCVLGDPQFMKRGSTYMNEYLSHRHPFIVVKNIWNCPPCKVCGILCSGPALECSKCNFTIHWNCQPSVK